MSTLQDHGRLMVFRLLGTTSAMAAASTGAAKTSNTVKIKMGTQSFTLFVKPSSELRVKATSLPAAHKGVRYTTTHSAAGGNAPFLLTVS